MPEVPEVSPDVVYVGLDWAAAVHAVCVMSAAGKVLAQFTIEHTADGITSLIRRLAKYGSTEVVQVGIERPNGRLVDLLLEAGHPVIPVSPNAIKTWREGEVISGAKSDDHASPWAARTYAQARARGHDHPHAIRILARAWIRVIYRCWHDNTPYNPNLHGGAQKLPNAA